MKYLLVLFLVGVGCGTEPCECADGDTGGVCFFDTDSIVLIGTDTDIDTRADTDTDVDTERPADTESDTGGETDTDTRSPECALVADYIVACYRDFGCEPSICVCEWDLYEAHCLESE